MNPVTRRLATLALILLLGMPVHAQKRPSEKTLGAPIYPKATFIDSFTEGPAARYLFASNDLTISVARFYERKTGKQPDRIEDADGMETYRFVLKGKRDVTLPELEVRVNHFPGGFTIPNKRGEARKFSTTILIIKKRR